MKNLRKVFLGQFERYGHVRSVAQVSPTTSDAHRVIGHSRCAAKPSDAVPRQFVPEDERMPPCDLCGPSERGQFALAKGAGEFELQTGLHIGRAARSGTENVLVYVKRHWVVE